jgi:DNA modification methylase
MVEVFREVKRVLRDDGTLWCNMGDSYNNREGQRVQGAEQRDDVAGWKQATNIGSTNVGSRHAPNLKPKDLCGIPWMLAFALRADGWYLRQDIIWAKPNPMPESVTDRCTKSHEYIFLLSKSERYYYNQEATLEPCSLRTPASFKGSIPGRNGGPGQDRRSTADRRLKAWDNDMGSNRTLVSGYGRKLAEPDSGTKNNSSFDAAMAIMPEKRNRRSVWTVNTQSFSDAHFATFPEELIKPCILAGCPPQGTVLDPFGGSGTTGLVAQNNGCKSILIELNPEYIEIMRKRLSQEVFQF